MEILSKTLEVAGTIIIGFMAIMVHHRFLHQHKIDRKVSKMMETEQVFGALGIGMIIIGYVLDLIF